MLKEIITGILLTGICILFFSLNAGSVELQFTGDENFYYQSSKNMIETGDWLTPSYYGRPRFQKPILYYWFVSLSMMVFGVGWFAARFPSILFGALTVLIVYFTGLLLFRKKSYSLFLALLLASTFKFFKYARFAIPDMMLLFFVTCSMYIIIRILSKDRSGKSAWILFSTVLALGTLTKGPVAVAIPALAIGIYTLFFRKKILVKKSSLMPSLLLYIGITLPWFIVMYVLHGSEFISHIWTRELAGRVSYYSGDMTLVENAGEYFKALFFYIPIVIVRFFPWSLFLPLGLSRVFRVVRADKGDSNLFAMVLSWFFAIFILFTLMGEKHSQYMLPLTAPFSLIVGAGFFLKKKFKGGRKFLAIALLVTTVVSFVSVIYNPNLRMNSAILGGFAAKMIDHGLEEGDKIGTGSHELIPQHIEVYVGRPVEKVGGKWKYPEYNFKTNKSKLENFFKYDKVYCVISRDDLDEFVSPKLRKRLKVIYKDNLWNRKPGITWDNFSLLLEGRMDLFLASVKTEYYLVTNK